MMYKPNSEHDSNPYREIRREPEHGFLFTVVFIYIPVVIFALAVRSTMLITGYSFVNLRIVDSFLWEIIKYFRSLFQHLGLMA